MNSISAVLIEHGPVNHNTTPEGTFPYLSDYYRQILDEPFSTALLELANDFDSGRCAACERPVGYGLHGDADQFTHWNMVCLVLVDRADTVTRLCSDCSVVLETCGVRVGPAPATE